MYRNKVREKSIAFVCILTLFFTFVPLTSVFANDDGVSEVPYQSYTYDRWGNANPAPNGYVPEKWIVGSDFGIGEFSSPEDLFFCAARDEIYIADTGNQRIIVTDGEFGFLRVIDELSYNHEALYFQKPTGIFVDVDGTIYIADEDMGAVVKCDQELNVLALFTKPESSLITDDFDYKPRKVVVDSYGKIYIQARGVFQGLVNLREDGTFIKYYGANKVEMTRKRIVQQIWKKILSDTASQSMQTFNPIEYGNIFLADDDFVYATAAATENFSQLLVKLNPLGIDIFNASLEVLQVSTFADITVDQDGIITLVDEKFGLIYQFDKTGRLMFAFGGTGDQLGLFKKPVAIMEANENLYVLDSDKNSITMFGLTEFGEKVRTAINLYNIGLYEESIEPWTEVIRLNANYLLAYTGIGKAYYQIEEYEEAMYYYKLANDRKNYSAAYKEYSLYVMRENFAFIVCGILVLFIGVKLFKWKRRNIRTKKGEVVV